MATFKVKFENNNAVSARPVNIITYQELKKLRRDGEKVMMEWCIVDADHEAAAIDTANVTVKTVWGSVLGIKSKQLPVSLFQRA